MANKVTRVWYPDKLGKMGIVEKGTSVITRDGYTTDWKSITVAKSVRIYAISRDSNIAVNELTNTFLQIPGQFHEALVYKAIATGYKEPRNLQIELAQYFDTEYNFSVKEGKKFSKSNYMQTGFTKPQDF